MKEQIITFETAKLAKEKGFQEDVYNSISSHLFSGKERISYSSSIASIHNYNSIEFAKNSSITFYSQPTQSLLQKWLRDKHNFNIYVYAKRVNHKIKWKYHIQPIQIIGNQSCLALDWDSEKLYLSYEEALEAGLQERLKLITI